MRTIVSHHTIEGGRVPPAPTMDQERLELLEEKRPAILEAMAKISTRFVAQVAEELPERWERIIRGFIADRPYEAKAQGIEGLARLKRELQLLQSHAPDLATKHLSGPEMWRHRQVGSEGVGDGFDTGASSHSSKTEPRRSSDVSDGLRNAEAEVLQLLRPVFGDVPWLPSAQGKLSEPLKQMFEAYDRLLLQLEDLETERRALSRQIASHEAQQLWEEA